MSEASESSIEDFVGFGAMLAAQGCMKVISSNTLAWVLSDQSQLVFGWRTRAESGQPQAAIFCHSAKAAERRIL